MKDLDISKLMTTLSEDLLVLHEVIHDSVILSTAFDGRDCILEFIQKTLSVSHEVD